MRMDASDIKQQALAAGARFVGVASVDRWAGAPENMHPQSIMPGAKSVIVIGCPATRGIVESIPGHLWIREHSRLMKVVDEVVAKMAHYLEDHGCKACNVSGLFIPKSFMEATSTGMNGAPYPIYDYFNDSGLALPRAGYLAGLGTIGKNGLLVIDGYGPNVILAAVVTTAEIEPDAIIEKGSCLDCDLCVERCPAAAISPDGKAGAPVFDATKCFLFCTMEGRVQQIAMERGDDGLLSALQKTLFMQTEAVPGTAACGDGCLVACPIDKRARALQ